MGHYYRISYLSEPLPSAIMDDKSLTSLFLQIGSNRTAISSFMKQFMKQTMKEESFLLLDATQVLSLSTTMRMPKLDITQTGITTLRYPSYIYLPQKPNCLHFTALFQVM